VVEAQYFFTKTTFRLASPSSNRRTSVLGADLMTAPADAFQTDSGEARR
jgi:hypothetical protein